MFYSHAKFVIQKFSAGYLSISIPKDLYITITLGYRRNISFIKKYKHINNKMEV